MNHLTRFYFSNPKAFFAAGERKMRFLPRHAAWYLALQSGIYVARLMRCIGLKRQLKQDRIGALCLTGCAAQIISRTQADAAKAVLFI